MRFGVLPEFNHKHRLEALVADADLIRQATDLFERVTALGQISDQFITFTKECPRVAIMFRLRLAKSRGRPRRHPHGGGR